MNWYLLKTHPRKEAYAKEHLINQGYEVYQPMASRLRQYRKKQVITLESLFPRYLFIRSQKQEPNWMAIRSTRGISDYITYRRDKQPSIVPLAIIKQIKSAETQFGKASISLDQFKKNDRVLITEGCFYGLTAIFSNYDPEGRSIVLLNILSTQSKPAKVKLHSSALLIK